MRVELDFVADETPFKDCESFSVDIIKAALEHADFVDDVELSLSLVSDSEIKRINKEFRGLDVETDVLSFPQYDDEGFDVFEDEAVFIGDIVISLDRVRSQAIEYGHGIKREYSYLLCHAVLHLMGYDHISDEDKIEMREAEEEILAAFDLTEGGENGI